MLRFLGLFPEAAVHDQLSPHLLGLSCIEDCS